MRLIDIPDEVPRLVASAHQETTEWCVLADAVAVGRFVGLEKAWTEAELANLRTNRTDCGSKPTPRECIVASDNEQMARLYLAMGIGGIGPDAPLDFQTLLLELANKRIVQMVLELPTGGHVALIVGYKKASPIEETLFYISDSWFGESEHTYREICMAYGFGKWVEAWGRFRKLSG